MSLAVLLLSLFLRAPEPTPSVLEIWVTLTPPSGDHGAVEPRLPAPPSLLAPRDGWRPLVVVRSDGRYAFVDHTRGDGKPYRQGRLEPAALARLHALVATIGLPSLNMRCAPPAPRRRLLTFDSTHHTRLVVPGAVFEWPRCADDLVPARILHLLRAGSSIVRSGGAVPATPIFSLSYGGAYGLGPSRLGLEVEADGRWRTHERSGQLTPVQLATLVERIRDTRLELSDDHDLMRCAAEPTHSTTLSLGVAGTVTWVAPCGTPPHADVHTLIALAQSFIAKG